MIKLDGYESSPTCIPNIGPKERRQRMMTGIITLIIAAVIAIFLILMGWAWWTRLILFVPLVVGFSSIFQAREKT